MPEYVIKTPHHNTTVQADRVRRDDRGDLKCFNDTFSETDPIVDVPVENFEGVYAKGWAS